MSNFTEAPASLNFRVVTSKGYNVQFTLRDDDETKLIERFKAFFTALEELKCRPEGQQASATPAPPPKNAVADEVRKTDPTLAAQIADDVAPVPDPPAEIEKWEIMDIGVIHIRPQPDNKCNVEFYAGDHQYPDLKVNKWKIESVFDLLKHVTGHDVTQPADLQCKCKVYYYYGKAYTKQDGSTGHYKNVAHVRPG